MRDQAESVKATIRGEAIPEGDETEQNLKS